MTTSEGEILWLLTLELFLSCVGMSDSDTGCLFYRDVASLTLFNIEFTH